MKQKSRSFAAKVLLIIFKPFVVSRLINKNVLNKIESPCVFVCNHSELFGPMTCAVTLPVYFRPWVDERMVDKKLAIDHIMNNTMSVKKWPIFIKKAYSNIAGRIASSVMKKFDPIKTGRLSMYAVSHMISDSLKALLAGDNLLIFPEDSSTEKDGRYRKTGLSPLHPSFSHLGKKYYEKTGETLTFYPMYADRIHRTLQLGTPVVFNPSNSVAEEYKRITSEVEKEIRQLYAKTEGKDIVVRYRKREKNKNKVDEKEQVIDSNER